MAPSKPPPDPAKDSTAATTNPVTKNSKETPVAKGSSKGENSRKKSAKRGLPGASSKKTKRRKPKKEETKSTTTTTTQTAKTPVNVYDAVLGEAEDLMAAAAEAQALGRLKMSSAYQLLLHARLVGLGKRFDRAVTTQPPGVATTSASPSGSPSNVMTDTPNSKDSPQDKPVTELAKFIPANIELDSAMMEHLARAAMELHHQRTGRRIHSDSQLASPPPKPNGTASKSSTPATSKKTTAIAWTEQEIEKVNDALEKNISDPAVIAKEVGSRTEAQVKAYLRNTKERQKGAQAVEEEWQQEESPRKRGGRGRKPPTQAMNTVPNAKLDARSLLSGKPF